MDFPDRNRTDSLSYVPFLSLHQHPAWEVIRNLDSFPFLRVCCRGFELFGQDWKAKSQSTRIKNGIFWYDFAGRQIPLLRSVPSFIYRTEGTYWIDVTVLTFSPSVTSPVHRCPLPLPITFCLSLIPNMLRPMDTDVKQLSSPSNFVHKCSFMFGLSLFKSVHRDADSLYQGSNATRHSSAKVPRIGQGM